LLGRVRDGGSLAQAIAAEPGFPAIAAGLVRAGEASGTLAVELGRLAEMMGRTAAIRTEIASALIYPMILLATACLSIGVIMLFVVPEFMPLFGDAGRAPPAAFAFLMAANAVLVDWGWLGVLVLALLIVGPRFLPASDALRRRWDGVKLRLPVAGGLLRELETGRFCRTLGTLVKSGLALPAAVVMAASAVDNTAMAAALAGVASGLREGRTLVAGGGLRVVEGGGGERAAGGYAVAAGGAFGCECTDGDFAVAGADGAGDHAGAGRGGGVYRDDAAGGDPFGE